MKNRFLEELKKVCNAQIPRGLMLSSKLEDDLRYLQEYLAKKYNRIDQRQKVSDRIRKMGYSANIDFNKWFLDRIDFYQKRWEEMIKYNGPIINSHKFLSETFKILDCTWWVQNAYQGYSSVKKVMKKLDFIAKDIEKSCTENKKELISKAKKICGGKNGKNWKAVSQTKMSKKEHEKERQLFSLFAELSAYDEFNKNDYENTILLPEQKYKQPDMIAENKDKKVYIEIKQIRAPFEEDDNLRSYSNYSGFVNTNFRQSVQNKILDFVCDARKKFECVKAHNKDSKFLILDYQEGIDVVAQLEDNQRNLDGIFSKEFFENLEKIHNMNILRRKYF